MWLSGELGETPTREEMDDILGGDGLFDAGKRSPIGQSLISRRYVLF
jgi:hypothetical protein